MTATMNTSPFETLTATQITRDFIKSIRTLPQDQAQLLYSKASEESSIAWGRVANADNIGWDLRVCWEMGAIGLACLGLTGYSAWQVYKASTPAGLIELKQDAQTNAEAECQLKVMSTLDARVVTFKQALADHKSAILSEQTPALREQYNACVEQSVKLYVPPHVGSSLMFPFALAAAAAISVGLSVRSIRQKRQEATIARKDEARWLLAKRHATLNLQGSCEGGLKNLEEIAFE